MNAGERAEMQRRSRVLPETLPGDRYPRIVEAAVSLSTCDDPDGYYDFGLDLILATSFCPLGFNLASLLLVPPLRVILQK